MRGRRTIFGAGSAAAAALAAAAILLLASAAQAGNGSILSARKPAPSPDGTTIAFSHMGDLWTVPAAGGTAVRLTVHEAYDDGPAWSPDGSLIAFESDREGNDDVYVIPSSGGEPTRLTCHDAWDAVEGWTRDGASVLFTSSRDTVGSEIYRVPVDGGLPTRVIRDGAFNSAISPDGRWIAFVMGRTPWWRKHYRGSASRDIWIRAADGGPSYRIVDWPGDDDRPMWGADGTTLYFVSERSDSVANIWEVTLSLPGPGEKSLPHAARPPVELTHHPSDGVQFANISADGTLIAYEWNAGVWKLRVPAGEPEQLEIDAPSDLKWNADTTRNLSSQATEFAFSPDESEIALVVHGEIYVCPFDDGEAGTAMRITDTPAREKDVAWMPDGKTLLFASDREGNYDVYAVTSSDPEEPALSKALVRSVERLTDSPDDDFLPKVAPDGGTVAYLSGDRYLWAMVPDGSGRRRLLPDAEILHLDWSPDSKWIAYSRTTLGHKEDIFILPAAGGEAVNVTRHPNDDFEPIWSDDGKRLSYASRTDDGQYMLRYLWLTREDYWKTEEEREDEAEAAEKAGEGGEPEPVQVVIDFDGLNERGETVMNMRGGYDFYAQTPDGHHYAFRSGVLGEDELWLVDWEGNKLIQVSEGGSDPQNLHWDNEGKVCYYVDSGGVIRTVAIDPESGEITRQGGVGFSVRLTVDTPKERAQMFNEAWRLLLTGFYDSELHGVDWSAVRSHYEPLALAAYTDEEFRMVVREMLGELSASHLGIYKYAGGGASTGRLGIRHDERYAGPGVRVRSVIQDGPADLAGIARGEYILAIDGHEVTRGDDYYCYLTDTAGREILVDVASKPGAERRQVRIRPASAGTTRRLVYEEGIRKNRQRVADLSGGRLGYLHIAGMGLGNLRQFEEDLFAQGGDKDGLIIDIRGNGGGSVHDEILRFLDRRRYGYTETRTRPPSYNPLELYAKPVALVIDESCYSDAEIFPMGWEALGLGPVVGTPTYGAVIGTNDVQLIDGTWFRVPGAGWYSMTGRNLEHWGIEPDVRVDAAPEDASRGTDAQLAKAVQVLLTKLP
jgi:tricorn protease